MSAIEETTTPTDGAVETAPEVKTIPKAPPVPLTLTVTLDDGVPEVTSLPWETTDVPRDGDEMEDGETFVTFDTKGEAVTVASLARGAYAKDKSKVDFNAFNLAYRRFQTGFVQYGIVTRANTRLEAVLSDAMMATRLAVTLQNGDPDYWGKSWAYRYLFDDRIRGFMRDQGFGLDETKRLLDNVRTNYARRHETVLDAAAIRETQRGNVKGAGVKSAKVETVTDETGNAVDAVVITYDKTDKDGNPKVETWKPGDDKMPKPLATAIRQAARRADGKDNGAIMKRLPEKVIGKPKPTPSGVRANEAGANERNHAEEASDALAAWCETIPNVAPLALVAMLHEALTTFSDYLIGAPNTKPTHERLAGGPKAIGEALAAPGNLLLATGASMAHDKPKGDVAPFRYVEATDEVSETNENEAADASGDDTNTDNDNS